MSDFTPDEKLFLSNLVSQGVPMKKACERVLGCRKAPVGAAIREDRKPTAAERKEALAANIEAAGGEVPLASASVAKFEQALAAAKADANDAADMM
tara:strand:+ start:192 stop:479 length:288 start_codon:yes stop_codon:yes gene_type:complete